MKKFRDFESAREFARALKLKGRQEWREYCKSGNKPDDIPVGVEKTYKKDFKSMGDWLGTGTIAHKDKVFRPYKEARQFVMALNLKAHKEWLEYCNSGNKPEDIPSNPHTTYKKEWKSWGNFLETGNIATKDRKYLPYNEAREFVRKLNLKGNQEWREYCKSGNKPDDIPASPDKTYKNEFKGYGDWLDNEKIYRSYKEAREFAKNLGLKSKIEWQEYCKSGDKPDDIPATPWNIYKEWSKK